MSKNLGFMGKKSVRLLWYVVLIFIASGQIVMFVQTRRQNLPLFHSTRELALVAALVAVGLLGVFVKSRQNRAH